MKNVPYARHQLNTYCWSHELPRLHTVGQMVGTPTALSATPSAPPPHCQPTGHHSIPTVSRLVNPSTPLLADWSSLQHTLSADWSPLHPHCQPTGHLSNIPCRPTGHHANPTVGQLGTTPTYPVGRLVITPTPLSAAWSPLQHTLSAAPSAPPPHCRPTGHSDWSSLTLTLSAA